MDGTTPQPYVAATAVTPAIFPTRVTQNVVSGGGAPDQNAASVTAYDRWGRSIVTIDPDGVGAITQYAPNQTDVATSCDGLGGCSRTLTWDAVGNVLSSADALGYVSTKTYSFWSTPVVETAPDGIQTLTMYDEAWRPIIVRHNTIPAEIGSVSGTYVATSGTTDAILDMSGQFEPGSPSGHETYVPIAPVRVYDSRSSSALSANTPRTIPVAGRPGVPSNAVAVTGNLTVTGQTYAGYVYLGPEFDIESLLLDRELPHR